MGRTSETDHQRTHQPAATSGDNNVSGTEKIMPVQRSIASNGRSVIQKSGDEDDSPIEFSILPPWIQKLIKEPYGEDLDQLEYLDDFSIIRKIEKLSRNEEFPYWENCEYLLGYITAWDELSDSDKEGSDEPETYDDWVDQLDSGASNIEDALVIHKESFLDSYSSSEYLDDVEMSFRVLLYLHQTYGTPSTKEITIYAGKLEIIRQRAGINEQLREDDDSLPWPLNGLENTVKNVSRGGQRVGRAAFSDMNEKLRIADEHDRFLILLGGALVRGSELVKKALTIISPFLMLKIAANFDKIMLAMRSPAYASVKTAEFIFKHNLLDDILKATVPMAINSTVMSAVKGKMMKNIISPLRKKMVNNAATLTIQAYGMIGMFENMCQSSRELEQTQADLYNLLKPHNLDFLWHFIAPELLKLEDEIAVMLFEQLHQME